MAFDQQTRNRLQRFVSDARKKLSEEFTRQLQNVYGIDPASGLVTPLENLGGVTDSTRETARILRDTLAHYLATSPSEDKSAALDRIVREQAFTVLNRLAALRMAEARGLLIESLGNGYNSKGFQLYARLAGTGLGETGDAYRFYLFSIFDEFALDLKVLFDRFSPYGRLFPREPALLDLLALINDPEIAPLWAEDETIGWIYQYFNSKEERKQMRDESTAPRNSRELAVRNQFFTPRYVVEFLTDNTLGRIWYEMTKGKTRLKEQCRYLVRRPTEIFLEPGESQPEVEESADENPSQEELLKQPAYIPHRPLKDPREIRVLDPACGSMHFGLYAFDLLEVIYEEAWDLEASQGVDALTRSSELQSLKENYADKEAFMRDVPRLIVEHNIHGIDIDPRAVQIAGLSLWLRAQRAWQEQNMKATERPQIRRSNIVCAEPMPGEESLLEEFLAKHFSETPEDRVLGQLVRCVFDEMKLAGEAGSLLKIEDVIAAAVAEAKAEWQAKPKAKQETLFTEMTKPEQQPLKFESAGITDEMFWHEAEEHIYAALREYAEEAEGSSYQKRLFVEDAARGFAFIDICRKRYDVVLMNPPFGEFTKDSKRLAKQFYPLSSNDILTAFLDRYINRLEPFGLLGAITSRTCFFLLSFQPWREEVVLKLTTPIAFADLGQGIMDAAMVEASAYILQRVASNNPMLCIRLLTDEDKQTRLLNALSSFRAGDVRSYLFLASPSEYQKVPGSPFCYWVESHVRDLYVKLPPFDSDGREAKQGLATGEDFRFVRVWWEVQPSNVISLHKGSTKEDYRSATIGRVAWCAFAKGGAFSPFYQDLGLVVRWTDDGREIRNFADPQTGYVYSRYRGAERYFEPGFTYADRSAAKFAPRVLPEGAVISVKGSGIYCGALNSAWSALGVMNSNTFSILMDLLLGRVELAKSYQVNTVGRVPWPSINNEQASLLGLYTHAGWQQMFCLDRCEPTSHAFLLPELAGLADTSLTKRQKAHEQQVIEAKNHIEQIQRSIDEISLRGYELSEKDLSAIAQAFTPTNHDSDVEDDEELSSDDSSVGTDIDSLTVKFTDYLVGCALGRWDIRFATGEKPAPELPDPFAPLPVCPPGMLQNKHGLPAEPEDVPNSYPLRISWQGILVDNQGHKEDIESRVQEALRVIWKDRADDIESSACEILSVRSLREYFRKPSAFFADHLKRYSKSRRQAPIYLPLSTASGSYMLWLYYHRLNDQTLYTCVVDFVEPKLREVTETLNQLRGKASNRSRGEEKEFEQLQDLELELQEFRDELLRLAKLPWKPNLNDGVQITAAPLWKLFRLPKWQKTLKETWQKLEKGDYDWAHLAMTIWPERVVPKCVKDRSFAIAHEVEDLFWIEDETKWRNLRTTAEEIEEQKKRQRSAARERVKKLLTELAASDAANLSAEQVRIHLANGDWDDREVALRLYPDRMAEKCWLDPTVARKLALELPSKRTKAAFEKFAKKLASEGCADVGQKLGTALKGRDQSFGAFWAELESGQHDELAKTLSLWSDRVVDKCATDVELAERHGIHKFLWVQHPTETWRKREDPKVEVINEIARRRGVNATYK